MTTDLEDAQFAVEAVEEALRLWDIPDLHDTGAGSILIADLLRARGVLLAIQRRQARQTVDTTTPACENG
jgi:hypothetical protein